MKLKLLFIGSKFLYNTPLRGYITRKVEQKYGFIDSIVFYKDGDNSIFLGIEEEVVAQNNLIIISSKKQFPTIGKVICTITQDNQILKDGFLLPSKCSIYDEGSYLIEYNSSNINVLHIDEMQKMPELLIRTDDDEATMYIFDEDESVATTLLTPLSQTYDIKFELSTIIEGCVIVNIKSSKYGNISKFISFSKQLLPKKVIATSCIFAYVIDRLASLNKKITIAESCTGGLLTYYFTKNNGASKTLKGSLVTYSNELKEGWLGVEQKTLIAHGAVSAEVVEEMSFGALSVGDSDFAISISGIAGDGGGTEEKPVGTIFIGIRSKTEHMEFKLSLSGDRNYIQHQSVFFAIKALITSDKEIFF